MISTPWRHVGMLSIDVGVQKHFSKIFAVSAAAATLSSGAAAFRKKPGKRNEMTAPMKIFVKEVLSRYSSAA